MSFWDYAAGCGCAVMALAAGIAAAVILFGGAWLVLQAVLG